MPVVKLAELRLVPVGDSAVIAYYPRNTVELVPYARIKGLDYVVKLLARQGLEGDTVGRLHTMIHNLNDVLLKLHAVSYLAGMYRPIYLQVVMEVDRLAKGLKPLLKHRGITHFSL